MPLKTIFRASAFLAAILPATNAFAAVPDLCFAYLRNGDVFISCGGREDLISRGSGGLHSDSINSYAIAEQQGVLGIVISLVNLTASPARLDDYRMVELKSGKAIMSNWYRFNTGSIPSLIGTCGGLFGVVDPAHRPIRHDLLNGPDPPVDPYTWFRCSADRTVVAGIAESNRVLYEGTPPQIKVAPPESAAYYEFNMSPNGKYLAYASDRQPLCVWSATGVECAAADAVDSTHDLASVRDDGEVLVALTTADKCVFKSATVFSPARPNDAKAKSCIGIGHWRPGMKSPEIVEPLGRAPQWINPDTANLLRQWSRKTKGYF